MEYVVSYEAYGIGFTRYEGKINVFSNTDCMETITQKAKRKISEAAAFPFGSIIIKNIIRRKMNNERN